MVEDYLEGNRVIVLVRALRRNRAQRKYNRYKEIYYKKLTQAVMEAEKSRPRRADGMVPVWVCRPENQESRWYRFSPSLSPKVGEDQGLSWKTGRERILYYSGFYSIQAFNRLDEAHHIGEGNLFYTAYLFKCLSHAEIPSWTYQLGLVKLTHKVNHHVGPTFTESFPSITILVFIRSESINKSLLS